MNRPIAHRFIALAICLMSFGISQGLADEPGSVGAGKTGSESQADLARQRFENPETKRWQIGLKLNTNGVSCNDILATFPVPMEWPEQTVNMVAQQIDPSVNQWEMRDLPGGARQVVFTIPRAIRGSDPEILFDFDVTRSRMLPPEKTDDLVIPTKIDAALKIYLGNSPYIDATDIRIRNAAKEFGSDAYASDWTRVEAIYDWVREKVEYVEGDIKTASQALKDGKGDCEELTSLFVAICRANKIPARMVWIPDHCYPEFYLEDAQGTGYWFPCQAAGTRQFGGMDEYRPVLQKGDRFKVPEKKQQVRYVAEFFRCLPEGKKDPIPVFVRNVISD